ncbi:50S ribosomal protein L18 [Candidatus Uhrbacteria bacterium]|nr:50S ribosomal protein L18 [Candidatus Uhrbacteria bacterium]
MKSTQQVKRARRHKRIRARVIGTAACPRLSVFRSGRFMYAQLIDDAAGKTLCAVSDAGMKKKVAPTPSGIGVSTESVGKNDKPRKVQQALATGKALAEKAKANGITKVVFDRSGYAYHGRVQAVADGARAGGLQF